MLTHKLDYEDLNHDKLKKFDGTMVYAQQKRQQVVMTEYLAKKHPNIYFASMHPGWSDTPGNFNFNLNISGKKTLFHVVNFYFLLKSCTKFDAFIQRKDDK